MEKTGEGMFAEMAKTLEGGADDGGEEAARNVASELAVELVSVVDEEDSNRTRAKFMRVLMLALNIDPEKLEWSPEMDSEVPCRAAHDRQASMMRWAAARVRSGGGGRGGTRDGEETREATT